MPFYIVHERKKKGGTVEVLPKLCCLNLQGLCQFKFWSQTSIGRSHHQGTMARQGGEGPNQNIIE